jgi:hypothetical protein
MSDESDNFWINLAEKFFGLLLLIIGAIVLFYTATSPDLANFTMFFGVLSVILVIIGLVLLLVKAPE